MTFDLKVKIGMAMLAIVVVVEVVLLANYGVSWRTLLPCIPAVIGAGFLILRLFS